MIVSQELSQGTIRPAGAHDEEMRQFGTSLCLTGTRPGGGCRWRFTYQSM